MSDTTLESIEKLLNETREAFAREFAGKDRHLLDPSTVDPMVATVKKAMASLDALGALTASEGSAALRTALEGQLAIFEREKRMTVLAREMGPAFDRFAIEGAAANFVFDRYARHFAGQGRDSRDVGLLREMLDDLRQIKKRMLGATKKLPDALQADVNLVQDNLDRYTAEEREIATAIAAGTTEERADRLAMLANQQFAIYQAFFAGQSRLTRRPALLVRLIDNLKRYRGAMFELKSKGLDSQSNTDNIAVVDGRLEAYETELAEIRKVRSGIKLNEIMSNLGGAANELFEQYRNEYANKSRTTVSAPNLSIMIDKLDEIRRQMEELGRVEKNDANIGNQRVVREYQFAWIQELQAILQVQVAVAT